MGVIKFRMRTMHTQKPKRRPLLRGVSHLLAFFVSLYTGWKLYTMAPPGTEGPVLLYAMGISGCFGASGFLHVPTWGPVWYRRMRQLDHSMVFILIASTYNFLSILPGGGRAIIWIGWFGALVGVLFKVVFFEQVEKGPKGITFIPYLVLGWSSLWELQRIGYYYHFIGWGGVALCILGGIAVSVGALCYTFRTPNLFPGVFGHHEVLHLGVIVAIYCFYGAA